MGDPYADWDGREIWVADADGSLPARGTEGPIADIEFRVSDLEDLREAQFAAL